MKYFLDRQELVDYSGTDKAIKMVRDKLINNSSYELNNFELEYCSTNLGFGEWHIDSTFTISESVRTKLQDKYGKCNSEIHIDDIIGETTDYIQIYGNIDGKKRGYYFIPQKAFTTHPIRNYKNIINFESIERLDKKGRKAYGYQKEGSNFLLQEKKCILADDKGLGKTYEAITSALVHGKKTLVVCLSATKKNWEEEIFSFTRKCVVIKGRTNYPSTKNAQFIIANFDIIYGQKDRLKLEDFDCIIIDESQKVTNPKADMTKGIISIIDFCKPTYVWSLSATPFQRIEEFVPLLQFLGVQDVQTYPKQKKFLERYCEMDSFDKANFLSMSPNLATQNEISNVSKRCKVGLEYSGKKYNNNTYKVKKGSHGGLRWFFQNLTQKYFDNILTKGGDFYFEVVHGSGDNSTRFFSKYSSQASIKEKKQHIKDFLSSPFHPNSNESNIKTLKLKIHSNVNGNKSVDEIYYSWFKIETIKDTKREHEFRQRFMKKKLLRRLIDDKDLNKSIPNITFKKHYVTLPQPILNEYNEILADEDLVQQLRHLQFIANAKVPYTIELIEKEVPKEDKFIIFTTFTEELELFREHYGDACLVINGKVNTDKRQAMTKQFMKDDSIRCIIANIIAGGTGLNIIAANHTYQSSGHFNPNLANQGSGRTRRLGQTKDCIYTEILVDGTEDNHVKKVNNKKNKLINFMLNHENRR